MINNEKAYEYLSKNLRYDNSEKMIKVVDKLIENGFDINFKPNKQASLLQISIANHCDDFFKHLIKKGANYNVELVSIDLEDYDIGFAEHEYRIYPKIADMLVKYQKWDLLKIIIDNTELCLDGTLYRVFDKCLHNYKAMHNKKYFNDLYSGVFTRKEMPKVMNSFRQDYDECINILKSLSERFNIDLRTYELCSDTEWNATLESYCAPFPYDVYNKKSGINFEKGTPETVKALAEYLKIFDIIMNEIYEQNLNNTSILGSYKYGVNNLTGKPNKTSILGDRVYGKDIIDTSTNSENNDDELSM